MDTTAPGISRSTMGSAESPPTSWARSTHCHRPIPPVFVRGTKAAPPTRPRRLPAAPAAGRLPGPLVGAAEGGGASCAPARGSWRGPARPVPSRPPRRGMGPPGAGRAGGADRDNDRHRSRAPTTGLRPPPHRTLPAAPAKPPPRRPHMPGLTRPHLRPWGRCRPRPHTHRQRGRGRRHSRRLPPLLRPPPLRPEQVPGEEARRGGSRRAAPAAAVAHGRGREKGRAEGGRPGRGGTGGPGWRRRRYLPLPVLWRRLRGFPVRCSGAAHPAVAVLPGHCPARALGASVPAARWGPRREDGGLF